MALEAAKKATLTVLALALVLATATAPFAGHAEPEEPGQSGERLEFVLKWSFVVAGYSTMQIEPAGEGRLLMSITTKSSPFLSTFYKVHDRMESLVRDTDSMLPYYYHLKLREGKHRKERRVTYNQDAGTIVLNNIKDNKVKEYDALGEINDMISAFHRVRGLVGDVGDDVAVRVFDDGKLYDITVRVIKKETVTVPAGTFDTVVIMPELKSEGIFVRKGKMLIWLTDDERHMPVKIKSKIKVGAVNAYLTYASGLDDNKGAADPKDALVEGGAENAPGQANGAGSTKVVDSSITINSSTMIDAGESSSVSEPRLTDNTPR